MKKKLSRSSHRQDKFIRKKENPVQALSNHLQVFQTKARMKQARWLWILGRASALQKTTKSRHKKALIWGSWPKSLSVRKCMETADINAAVSLMRPAACHAFSKAAIVANRIWMTCAIFVTRRSLVRSHASNFQYATTFSTRSVSRIYSSIDGAL